MTEYRAQFDAHVEFTNGGRLDVAGFRIDVPSAGLTADEVGALFVASLGLLLAGRVELNDLIFVEEPHRGTRGTSATSRGAEGASTSVAAGAAAAPATRFVELSHVIREGLVTYPGLPAPEITPFLTRSDSRARYAPGTEFAMDIISLIGNTGTYLDSPYHRYADGQDLAGMGLERLADLPTVLVRIAGTPQRAVDRLTLAALGDLSGAAVLIHSGDDARFGTPEYARDAAFLTRDGAEYLVQAGVALAGIDAVNIDAVDDVTRPAHSILLAARIPVVEHLTGLDALPPRGALFTAAPPRITAFGTFPVRAFAKVTGA